MVAAENIKLIKSYGVKADRHHLPALLQYPGRDYKDLGLDMPVEHYSTYVSRLITDGRLKLKPEPFDCTYHDSCYLGRYWDILRCCAVYSRRLAVELPKWINRAMTVSVAAAVAAASWPRKSWAAESAKAGQNGPGDRAPLLISNCPYCLTMFEDGIKTGGPKAGCRPEIWRRSCPSVWPGNN